MQIQNAILTGSTAVYGPITIVSGSLSGASVSASYVSVLSQSLIVSGGFSLTGSMTVTGSTTFTGNITIISGSLSGTASLASTASSADVFLVRNNLTASSALVTGVLTAQTLVVQTITSSIEYSSGSNIFGSQLTNTQTFTGSVNITGSFKLIGSVTGPLYINTTGSGASAQLDVVHGSTQEGIAIKAITGSRYSPLIIRDHLGNTAFGFNEFNRLFASGAFMLGDPNAVEGTSVTAGTIAIFPSSSVSGGPLIQFSANGRIRPGNTGDRLSIDGNPLYLNNTLNTNVVIGGGNLGIGVVPTANWGTTAIQMNHYGSLSSGDDGARAYITMGFGMYDGGAWTPKYVLGSSAASAYRQRDGAHEFYTAGTGTINAAITFTQAMTITGSNVGIGTSTPGCRLDLVGGNAALNDNKLLIRFASDSNHSLEYNSGYNGPFLYGYAGAALGYRGTGVIWTSNTNYYNYGNTTTWNTTSDRRVKQNINALTNAINKISQLNPVSFDYTEEFATKRSWEDKQKLNNIGFIAQEYENVFPDDVDEKEETIGDVTYEDFKTINTTSIVPYLVKAIQELKIENDALKAILQRNNIN